MKPFCLVWFILDMVIVVPILSPAQGPGAMHAGLAGISAASPGSMEIFHNPAGLAGLACPEVSLDAAMPYCLPELNVSSLAGAFPLGSGGMGFGLQCRGFEAYREYIFLAGYGCSFSDDLAAGVSIGYHHISQADGYPSLSMAGFKAGIICRISRRLKLYVLTVNPGGTYYSSRKDARLPVRYMAGLITWIMQGNARIFLEAEKEFSYPLRIRLAMDANIGKRFSVRAGVAIRPAQISLGTGILMGNLRIDLAGIMHQYLGWYPQASIIYQFRKP